MTTRKYAKRAVSCECGGCRKCNGRKKNARLRQTNPEYALKGREAAKAHYWSLAEAERKAIGIKRAEYQQKYRDENRERKKELGARLYAANREESLAKSKAYYHSNPEPFKARAKARHAADPKAVADRAARWNKENPERRSLIGKVSSHKRRALMEGAGGVVTGKQLRHLFERQGGKCAGCKKRVGTFEEGKWHHDHVMPIALGGANTIENAQILCPSCNCRKQAKPPERWAAELGRLFA